MQAYHYPLPLVIARSSCKLGVQTDRTRSRSLCRGHGVSSDVLAKVRMSQTKSDSICFHYTYCRKYPNPITKNFSFFLKFFSSFYARQVGRYAARWRPVFRSAAPCTNIKAKLALFPHLSDWQKHFAAYPDFLASLPSFPAVPPNLLLLCCIKKEAHHQRHFHIARLHFSSV